MIELTTEQMAAAMGMKATAITAKTTRPMARSPCPARSSATVNSGRVVPAKNAAGSMMAMAMVAVPRLNSA